MLLAGGVAQALVTTAAGLIIGIAAMAFYSLFRGRASSMISDLEAATTHILNIIASQRARRNEPSGVLENDDLLLRCNFVVRLNHLKPAVSVSLRWSYFIWSCLRSSPLL